MSKRLRLIVFAKAPLPGLAKTRLIPALGAEGAAQLAGKMLRHTLDQCARARLGSVELCVTPDCGHDFWKDFSLPENIVLSSQGGGDLGKRLLRAAKRSAGNGESVLLLGTDCPQLTAKFLKMAASALEKSDAVIYPTRDGGYALLGLNRVEAPLFEDISWSTEVVARQTRERMVQCDLRCEWLETLVDIDEPADLEFLPTSWKRNL
jgi:hypothetical protein